MFESKGIKRGLSIALFLIAQAPLPVLQPWLPLINAVASVFGVVGIGHAVMTKE